MIGLKIDISELRKQEPGARTLVRGEERWEPEEADDGLPVLVAPVRYTVELERLPHRILAHVEADTVARLSCDRCLGEFEQPLHLDYAETYQTPEESERWPRDDKEADDRPTRLADPRGGTVDLGEGLRENLFLGLPLKRLCKPDCRGLCPVCGANLNEVDCGHRPSGGHDPRWAALERLRLPGTGSGGDEGREKSDGQS
ncbi:MAG: DUF177 domain-containing protein [Bacillota bacterium]|nr:DUF177 domain-containing protein [Bacillota bacterium]